MCAKKKGKFSKSKPVSASGRKIKIAIAACSVFLAAAVGLLLFLMNRDNELLPEAESTFPIPESSIPVESSQTETEMETTEPVLTTAQQETTVPTETTKPEETTKPDDKDDNKKPTQPPATQPPATQPPATQPPATQPPATEPPKVIINLPYTIPGTTLTIQRVAGFDGIYLENGSDSSVSGVAMMMLTNTGFQAVEYAKITMTYDDKVLTFEVSALKPGGVIAVQEAGKNSCASGDLIHCSADVAVLDSLGMSEDMVKVEDNGDNTLTVTNVTEQEIVTIRIFYKYYMAEENAYVGGITYTAKISNLGPNASVVINPSHYASDACEVVMVRTYDTDA